MSANSPNKGREICLRLYIASTTPNSERARTNLHTALQKFSPAECRLEMVDVFTDAKRAIQDNVIVTPTLIVIGQKQRLVMIGDLSDTPKLQGLLKAAGFA